MNKSSDSTASTAALFYGSAAVVSLALGFTVLLLAGCGKSGPSAAQSQWSATNPPVDAVNHEPVYAPAPAATSVTTPAGGPDLAELNRCLLRWVLGHRRKPANFEEFAASANVAIPSPPAGKKYAINSSMHIVLLDQ